MGRGRNAIVYLAHERHPRRDVAIKVLLPDVTQQLGRERFLHEIDLCSNLTHPHIVPIYAAGDADGLLYYVMPFVEGETLRQRLQTAGPLPLAAALQIAAEVAEALNHAHRRDVVHRDLKPENILLHDGHALVADFGVARALEEAGSEGGGESGAAAGTAAYVSPEQAADPHAIDPRDDLYALGCVLFEMLTGEAPFGTARDAAQPVPSLRARAPQVPAEVDQLVRRALAAAPEDRYQRAGEMAETLASLRRSEAAGAATLGSRTAALLVRGGWRTIAVGLVLAVAIVVGTWRLARGPGNGLRSAGGRYEDSVAMLPVENRTGEPWLDSAGDALTYEVVSELQKIPELKASAYMSVRAQEAESLSPRATGEALGVRLLLVSQFRRVGERLRLDAELVEAGTGRLVVTGQWPVTTRNERRLLNELGTGLVSLIAQGTGLSDRPELAPRAGPAHHEYVLGKYWLGRRTPAGIRLAVTHFRNAIRLDTASAQAYEGMSTAYVLALFYRYDVGLDGYEVAGRALASAERAVMLDPAFASAYAARGYVTSRTYGPWRQAARDFGRALELEPNSAQAVAWSASARVEQGDPVQGIEATRRAIDLDPLSPARQLSLAYAALPLARYDLVIESARRASELEPELAISRALEGRALLLASRPEECLALEFGPHEGVRASCLYALGRQAEATAIIDSITMAVRQPATRDTVYTDVVRVEDLACYYAWIGDVDRAIEWLREAMLLSPIGIERRVLQSALFDRVRADPAARRELDAIIAGVWPRVREEASRAERSGVLVAGLSAAAPPR